MRQKQPNPNCSNVDECLTVEKKDVIDLMDPETLKVGARINRI